MSASAPACKRLYIVLVAVITLIHECVSELPEVCPTDKSKNKIDNHFYKTPCGKAIEKLGKGQRPAPDEYFEKSNIVNYLRPFSLGGISYFVPEANIIKYNFEFEPKKPTKYIGYEEGQFVTTKAKADEIAKAAMDIAIVHKMPDSEKGKMMKVSDLQVLHKKIEDRLGIPDGWRWSAQIDKSPRIVQVEYALGGAGHKLRMASGNEHGANDAWVPGGYAGAEGKQPNIPEAVVDKLEFSKAKLWLIYDEKTGGWLKPPKLLAHEIVVDEDTKMEHLKLTATSKTAHGEAYGDELVDMDMDMGAGMDMAVNNYGYGYGYGYGPYPPHVLPVQVASTESSYSALFLGVILVLQCVLLLCLAALCFVGGASLGFIGGSRGKLPNKELPL